MLWGRGTADRGLIPCTGECRSSLFLLVLSVGCFCFAFLSHSLSLSSLPSPPPLSLSLSLYFPSLTFNVSALSSRKSFEILSPSNVYYFSTSRVIQILHKTRTFLPPIFLPQHLLIWDQRRLTLTNSPILEKSYHLFFNKGKRH